MQSTPKERANNAVNAAIKAAALAVNTANTRIAMHMCSNCGLKPQSEFYKYSSGALYNRCKVCHCEAGRRNRQMCIPRCTFKRKKAILPDDESAQLSALRKSMQFVPIAQESKNTWRPFAGIIRTDRSSTRMVSDEPTKWVPFGGMANMARCGAPSVANSDGSNAKNGPVLVTEKIQSHTLESDRQASPVAQHKQCRLCGLMKAKIEYRDNRSACKVCEKTQSATNASKRKAAAMNRSSCANQRMTARKRGAELVFDAKEETSEYEDSEDSSSSSSSSDDTTTDDEVVPPAPKARMASCISDNDECDKKCHVPQPPSMQCEKREQPKRGLRKLTGQALVDAIARADRLTVEELIIAFPNELPNRAAAEDWKVIIERLYQLQNLGEPEYIRRVMFSYKKAAHDFEIIKPLLDQTERIAWDEIQ